MPRQPASRLRARPSAKRGASAVAEPSRRQLSMEQVGTELRRRIIDGLFPAGQPLPTERALARDLGVAQASVHWAMADLVQQGLVLHRSERVRMVNPQAPEITRDSLLGQTLVLLHGSDGLRLSWSDELIIGCIQASSEHRLHVLHLDPERLRGRALRELIGSSPRGIIDLHGSLSLRNPQIERARAEIQASGIPWVLHMYAHLSSDGSLMGAASDHRSGARTLANWLIGRGCTRILPIFMHIDDQGSSSHWLHQRLAGLAQAVAVVDAPVLPTVWLPADRTTPTNAAEFSEKVEILTAHLRGKLSQGGDIDAVMAITDGACMTLILALERLGIRVPVVGYDHYAHECPELAFGARLPAATIDQCLREVGRVLVDQALQPAGAARDFRLIEPRLVLYPDGQSPT